MRDEDARRALERLSVPPEDPEFFPRLRGRLLERDRTSARRWRAASLALAAVAAVALAAVGAVATARGGGAVLDRTLSCAADGVVPGIPLEAWPAGGSSGAGLRVGGAPDELLGWSSTVTGLVLDGARCRGTSAAVPFDERGLPFAFAHADPYSRYEGRCFPTGRLLVRLRLSLDREGRPHRAVIALRSGADGRPLALLRWQPDLVQVASAAACPGA
jgi:hypothetical protein